MTEMEFEKKATLLCFKAFSSEMYDGLVLPLFFEYAKSKNDFENKEYFRVRTVSLAKGHFGGLADTRDSVSVTVCHEAKSVKFGPKGNIIITNKGHGVGSALMCSVVDWLKRKGLSSYQVEDGDLSNVDAKTEEDQDRRNKFYIRHGFRLQGVDGEEGLDVRSGHFSADSVAVLTSKLREGTSILEWEDVSFDMKEQKRRAHAGMEYRAAISNWYKGLGSFSRYVLRKNKFPG